MTLIHVVTHSDHPDVDPYVFANRIDAIRFAAARWPSNDPEAVRIASQTLIDQDLAEEMIADEMADQ